MAARYHHGDLRSALLDHAEAEIESVGYEALELKSLAALAGVTKGAPYRHFKGRDDLLMALAERGFTKLQAMRAAAAARPGDARDRVMAMARAFVEFAKAHPKLFRMMFVSNYMKLHFDPTEPGSIVAATFGSFEQAIGAVMPKASARQVRAATLACAASLQGFVLMLDFAKFDELLIDGETEDSLLLKLVGPHICPAAVITVEPEPVVSVSRRGENARPRSRATAA